MRLKPPIVVVHGGAGEWRSKEALSDVVKALREAVVHSYEFFRSGSSFEVVVEAVKVLEDSGVLNAGIGSVVDVLGNITMDAGVMDSRGRLGAVAAVSYPKNPILLAKFIAENTDHILVVGSYADELARKLGLEKHPGPTPRVKARFKELRHKALKGELKFLSKSIEVARKFLGLSGDTVGAVALDANGSLAAAVSTGGIMLKLPGRVGDSAIPGAGFYANKYVAAVATGIGETIIRNHLTLLIAKLIEEGLSASEAASKAIDIHTSRFGKGTAGVIAVDRYGHVGASYNTKAMPWAFKSYEKGFCVYGLPTY